VDRLFDWKPIPNGPVRESLDAQADYVRTEFEKRMDQSILNLNEQGLNVALYWRNPDPRKYVNIVPTSAITGEGGRAASKGLQSVGGEGRGGAGQASRGREGRHAQGAFPFPPECLRLPAPAAAGCLRGDGRQRADRRSLATCSASAICQLHAARMRAVRLRPAAALVPTRAAGAVRQC
jgi:hypothetical protein